VRAAGSSLTHNLHFGKRRLYPESNGDAREGRGFEPRAIPLCDTGISLFAQSELFGNTDYAMWALNYKKNGFY